MASGLIPLRCRRRLLSGRLLCDRQHSGCPCVSLFPLAGACRKPLSSSHLVAEGTVEWVGGGAEPSADLWSFRHWNTRYGDHGLAGGLHPV